MKPTLLAYALALAAGVLSLTPFASVHADPVAHDGGASKGKTADQKGHPKMRPSRFAESLSA